MKAQTSGPHTPQIFSPPLPPPSHLRAPVLLGNNRTESQDIWAAEEQEDVEEEQKNTCKEDKKIQKKLNTQQKKQ